MQRDTILWTRSEEHAPIAQQWLAEHAPEIRLHCAPLQRFLFRAPKEILRQLPADMADWRIIITSVNGAQAALQAFAEHPLGDVWVQESCWFAVGPGTADFLLSHGARQVITANPPDVHGLIRTIAEHGWAAGLLAICASNARPVLREAAAKNDWSFCQIIGYQPDALSVQVDDQWSRIGVVPLASAATWQRLQSHLSMQSMQDIRDGRVHLVAMGKHTADAIRESGLPLAGTATEPTIPALLAAAVRALRNA